MNFAFVCNQNQARSQVLSATFSKLLPQSSFSSFGIIAQEGTLLPAVIDSVFKDWGLDSGGRKARNVALHQEEIFDVDVVLAVTSFIAEEVSNLGFQGEIVDLEHEALSFGIDVRDPQLMPRRQCAYELAKYILIAHSALRKLGQFPSINAIKAYIPERESSIGAALALASSTKGDSSVIVYGDLVAPRIDLISEHFQLPVKYHFLQTALELEPFSADSSGDILVPAHSVMWPSMAYLNPAWNNFLQHLNAQEVSVITPPLKNNSGTVPESFLAALGASEIQVVK